MKKYFIVVLVFLAVLVSCAKESGEIVNVKEPEKLSEKSAYAMGSMIYKYNKDYFGLNEDNLQFFIRGFYDMAKDKALYDEETSQKFITEFGETEMNRMRTENLEKAEAFLLENAKADGVIATDSGLQYQVLTEGNGNRPSADSTVNVYYKLSDLDGNQIEAVDANNGPATFPLNQLVPGISEGLALMSEGATYKFWVHPNLGYGENGSGAIQPNQLLVFEFELLSIN